VVKAGRNVRFPAERLSVMSLAFGDFLRQPLGGFLRQAGDDAKAPRPRHWKPLKQAAKPTKCMPPWMIGCLMPNIWGYGCLSLQRPSTS